MMTLKRTSLRGYFYLSLPKFITRRQEFEIILNLKKQNPRKQGVHTGKEIPFKLKKSIW